MSRTYSKASPGGVLLTQQINTDRLLRARSDSGEIPQQSPVGGMPQMVYKTDHGRVHTFNRRTGRVESRFSERASWSWAGLGSGWTVPYESGPWPLLQGYEGEIYYVALGARVPGTTGPCTVEFHLNGATAAFETLSLPASASPPLVVAAISVATTGSNNDYLTAKLTAADAAASDLTAYARTL